MMIPLNEQSHAILHAKTRELARKYCGGNHDKLLSSLTVTRENLKEYIAEYGYPAGWWRFMPATYDGLYTVEQNGIWVVYFQERGRIDYQYPQSFMTKSEAVDFVLDDVYLKKT